MKIAVKCKNIVGYGNRNKQDISIISVSSTSMLMPSKITINKTNKKMDLDT
jgi:hypothetical protein